MTSCSIHFFKIGTEHILKISQGKKFFKNQVIKVVKKLSSLRKTKLNKVKSTKV